MQINYLEAIASLLGVNTRECRGDIGKLVKLIELRANSIFALGLYELTSSPPLNIVSARKGFNALIKNSGLRLQSSSMVNAIKKINSNENLTIHWATQTEIASKYLVGRSDRHGKKVGIRGPGRHSVRK